ncbi:protein adenylyltransferase SelO [Litoreibacter roseus]|uniref:Protein nucleotidyltransferase YdiU n=1 Tax=Litoreibacter roseus TaxID=2601869 RepID=A0A6N6JC01_9RHOB|nr:YdiU family protein [Litoreibacter roseus]GFE63695.1 UPF0061 protein [Litoreibacter roseus]
MITPVFDNHYVTLPERFYTRLDPVPVADPSLLAVNEPLAVEMGLDPNWLKSEDGLAMLAGNQMPAGSAPLAQVYAGHQFGGWSSRLGDGRANLLGEVRGPDGTLWDIQLKGSGPTPYSRMGDGRAWLGPVLREYVISEAMHALGVRTTRALAAVETGETVLRERAFPGAILTRVAPSHIRVGTFQYFASQKDVDGLATLLAFASQRHNPDLAPDDALGFLAHVVKAQAYLVARWMGLGFIHGVMNTDNTHVGGITIDYGPCAFMDTYDPAKVFSSIDQFGRYAYQAQPEILVWNLAQLASSLLPLMGDDTNKSIEAAQEVLHGFGPAYTQSWLSIFLPKLGIAGEAEGDIELVQTFLRLMAETGADFTNTFRALAEDVVPAGEGFAAWRAAWTARKAPNASALMKAANPAFIPRNHQIDAMIAAAVASDLGPFKRLMDVLSRPFDDQPEHSDLMRPPAPEEEVRQTFCGT